MFDPSTVTVDDFRAQFPNDFPYLPIWSADDFYNTGDEVYYSATRLFYTSRIDGNEALPTDAASWDKTQDAITNFVQDADITRAFAEALAVFNVSLFAFNDAAARQAYLYLVAFYLVQDAKARSAGLASAIAGLLASRTVGNVSEAYAIPPRILNSVVLSIYAQNPFGMKYLSFLAPLLTGNVQIGVGWTTP